MLNLFIKKLTRKAVDTKNGQMEKWVIVADDGKWYDSWLADWNKDWKEGDTLKLAEQQIQSREYNGKMYYTIRTLSGGRPSSNSNSPEILAKLSEIEKKIDALSSKLEQGTNIF